jgi:hypothetical protein
MHELGIAQIVLPGGGVDPNDPEPSKLPFALAAITIGVTPGPDNGILGRPEIAGPGAIVTLGLFHQAAVTAVFGNTTI